MVKTKPIEKTHYSIYQKKAMHAFKTMTWAVDNTYWTAAGREAVFTCIHITDALLAKYKGLRNVSKNHLDIVIVVATLLPMSDRKNQANRLKKIIQLKNLVDYESRDFLEKQAKDICLQATRFYEWACSYL